LDKIDLCKYRYQFEEGGKIMERKGRLMRWFMATFVLPVILFPAVSVYAGGLTPEPLGAEAFLAGTLPPPGFYVKQYFDYYNADKLKNDSGHSLTLARDGVRLDRLQVVALATRLLYVLPLKISLMGFDANPLVHTVIPVVRPSLQLDAVTPAGLADRSEHHSGVGDIALGGGLAWHHKSGLFHAVTGVNISAPTGVWNPNRLVNIGANCWSITPVILATLFFPWHPNLEFDIKMDYSFNTKNDDFIISPSVASKIGNMGLIGLRTNLTPGQNFHFDYCIAYALSKKGAAHQFRVGATGYFYQQTTDDNTSVGKVKNDLGRVFAIGPGVWWSYKKWIVESHVAFETAVRNRPQGINTWLTIVHAF
jgi:hypothetical protein